MVMLDGVGIVSSVTVALAPTKVAERPDGLNDNDGCLIDIGSAPISLRGWGYVLMLGVKAITHGRHLEVFIILSFVAVTIAACSLLSGSFS